ncbi:MAG: single-stranded-DNA-specific exonuclease RecJ [Deltaproteobacteria bacterium]|jgi:single-stranded-DNA-specific exonuclease|nr:single-stranded-DNA-specific exonuclease RecJ [Deltaproteobacteria bacterium]
MKCWRLPDTPVPPHVAGWAGRLGMPPFLAGLLWQRGLTDPQAMEAFLLPRLSGLAPPDAWPGLRAAADTLVGSITRGDDLLIWGDYDVDGVTGTALILQVLAFHGVTARFHLPHRQREGYGLNTAAMERFAAEGVRTILTVDCGISDVEAVHRATELGLRVVISDHHLPPERLPVAEAICNPRLAACPCPHLAGVGVAFFLMAAVNADLAAHTGRRMDMREVLDIVALGTLADVAPLTGQNRILVKNGLLLLASAERPGVAELKAVSGYNPAAPLGAGQVVFNLAPRLNAAGRIGSATQALDLLRAGSHEEAAAIAKELDTLNSRRRAEEDRILEEALCQAETQRRRAGLVIWGENWHQGVIGIVASRLVDAFYRPTVVLCRDHASFKGSGRSIPEFDLHAGLGRCADLLQSFGGHRQAAGLRLDETLLDTLRERFDTIVRETIGVDPLTPSLRLDGELDFALATDAAFLNSLEQFQPFGVGNPEPVFASPPLHLRKQRLFGPNRDHVALHVTDTTTGISLQAKLWRMAGTFPRLEPGARLHLAYTPGLNTYNGATSVELRVKDWKLETDRPACH